MPLVYDEPEYYLQAREPDPALEYNLHNSGWRETFGSPDMEILILILAGLGTLAVVWLLWLVLDFTNFKQQLMPELMRRGLTYKQADLIYAKESNLISARHGDKWPIPQIVDELEAKYPFFFMGMTKEGELEISPELEEYFMDQFTQYRNRRAKEARPWYSKWR